MRTDVFVGLDIGQSHDYTALAALERVELTGKFDHVKYAHKKTSALRLAYLERVPLGTPYPEMVERVREVMRCRLLLGRSELAVDATGVGRVVVDMLRDEDPGCRIWPVNITGGVDVTVTDGYYGVPKRDLMIGLQVLLQKGGLQMTEGLAEGEALKRELAEMRVKIRPTMREQFGNSRAGKNDDLVLAVSLGCWLARRICPSPPYGGDEFWSRGGDQNPGPDWLKGKVK